MDFIHLLNSGSAALDGTGQHTDPNGTSVIKPVWEVTEEDGKRCLENTVGVRRYTNISEEAVYRHNF